MPIISSNRFGSINGNVSVAANENYSIADCGRILYECERNDMAMFNAAMRSDMVEITAKNEGTLLESELVAMNEANIKDFFSGIVVKMKKLWAKLKGMFKKAYAMISAYVVRNGKAFVAMHRKALASVDKAADIGKSLHRKGTLVTPDFGSDITSMMANIRSTGRDEEKSSADWATKYLEASIGGGTVSDYSKDAKEYCFEEIVDCKLSQIGSVSQLENTLVNGGTTIKNLREAEKKFDKSMKQAIGKIESEAKTAIRAAETADNKDEQEAQSKALTNCQNCASGVEKAASTITRMNIRFAKIDLAIARKALARAIGVAATKTESVYIESIVLEGDEEIAALDGTEAEDLNPEEQEIVDAIVSAAEEQLENDDCGDGSCFE